MEEKIDNYILGRLSAEQTQAFEELMANDEVLRGEVALRREMITAVQLSAADAMLRKLRAAHVAEQAEEREAEAAKEAEEAFAEQQRRAAAERRRRRAFTWGFATVALAACFVVGLFVHLDYQQSYTAYGNSLQLSTLALRGEEVLSNDIIEAIEAEEYERAHILIAQAREMTFDTSRLAESTAEEVEYEREIYAHEQALVEWLEAVTLMREGRWLKARRQLKAIANTDSPYREEAERALSN
ncbi:MAG: hypothetical protein E7133_02735 [Rikenellaceae bacterium]|nr:hypothetical protein [Rikenellaceae bacterium]